MTGKMPLEDNQQKSWNWMARLGIPSNLEAAVASIRVDLEPMSDWCSICHTKCMYMYTKMYLQTCL